MVPTPDEAVKLLRERLSPTLVARLGVGDFAANLLDYLRTRRSPALPFEPCNLGRINALASEADPKACAWVRRIADEAVEGRLYAATHGYCDRFLPVDRERFDFTTFEHDDPQAIHGLNRMRWLAALAERYWDRCDRRYFDALMREWDFFAERVPPPTDAWMASVHRMGGRPPEPPYSELDTYIRLRNWWQAYWLMLHAEPMTPQRNAVLLARCLQAFDAAACRGIMLQEHNFTSMQMEALYLWAACLSEAVGMNVWRHAARTNLQASLARAAMADGGQWEMSISYQIGCVQWYGIPALLAARQGERWPDGYVDRLVAMAEMADCMVLPDGTTPAIGDSDRTADWRGALAIVRALRPDVRFTHPVAPTYASLWATGGRTWDARDAAAAAEPVRVFPDTGLAILRAGEGAGAAVAIMKNSPRRPSHAHEDNLAVCFEAFGQPLVVDAGRWIYDRSADRSWVISAAAHNVPWIADGPAAEADGVTFGASRWFHLVDRTGGPLADLTAAGIDDDGVRWSRTCFRGYVQDRHAAVTRHIALGGDPQRPWLLVVDRFSGTAEHAWASSWLLPTEQALAARDGGWTARLGDVELRVLAASTGPMTLEPAPRFWCPVYAEKAPALGLRFIGPLTEGVRAFAFVPSLQAPRAARLGLDEDRVMLDVDDTRYVAVTADQPRE